MIPNSKYYIIFRFVRDLIIIRLIFLFKIYYHRTCFFSNAINCIAYRDQCAVLITIKLVSQNSQYGRKANTYSSRVLILCYVVCIVFWKPNRKTNYIFFTIIIRLYTYNTVKLAEF